MDCTEIERFTASQISVQRYQHSVSTAVQAKELLDRYVASSDLYQKAWIAGIWHDCARQWTDAALLAFVDDRAFTVQSIERAIPMLLHGPVASALLADRIPDISDTVLRAIRWHTLGSPDMGLIGAVIYIADYLEPLRKHLTIDERNQMLAMSTLERLCLQVSLNHLRYLETTGRAPADSTMDLVTFLRSGGTFT